MPELRPHNVRRDGKLFFLISRRPLLDLRHEEIELYDTIDGHKTVAELEARRPGARESIAKWYETGILELVPPVIPPSSPHLVVIEPHMDDAVLSVGGRLLHRRGNCRITILSVVRWSNFTSYVKLNRNLADVGEITNLRLRESALVARMLGAEHRSLNWCDAPLRFFPPECWSADNIRRLNDRMSDFIGLFPAAAEVALLAEELARELDSLRPDELWIPMGLGDHTDHRTTRNACLQMLASSRDRFRRIPMSAYEDIPYARFAGHAEQIRASLMESGTRLVRATEDITDAFEEKLRLVSIYASQFKLSFMEPTVRLLAQQAAGTQGRFAEAYYRIEGEPQLPRESRLSRHRAHLARVDRQAKKLVATRTKQRLVTFVALPSGHLGRWGVDRKFLTSTFPNASLRFYVSSNLAWQAQGDAAESSGVKILAKTWREWVKTLWPEIFCSRTPIVILWWGSYGSEFRKRAIRKISKMLLPFRDVLFFESLSDFCGILNEQLAAQNSSR